MSILPTDAAARKRIPVFSGFMAYFPRAIAEVAKISFEGNEQHHPGSPLHWDKSKSKDHLDALARHLIDSLDGEHCSIHALAQVAWRALAELETRLENADAQDVGKSAHELKSRNSTAEFTQPPNCSLGVSKPTPPMHAVALEMAESALASRTLPGEVGN